MNIDKISRVYFYTKLGWGNYISWWLGAIAYITIIYELVLHNLFPYPTIAYPLIFISLMVLSFFFGYLASKKNIYGAEHAINAETNPYKDKILGKKELLGWKMNYQSLIQNINSTKLWLNWWSQEKEIKEDKLRPIRKALAEQERLLKEFEKMIKNI